MSKTTTPAIATALAALLLLALPGLAPAAPVLKIDSSHEPSEVPAGTRAAYELVVSNTGDEETSEPISVEFDVPAGVEITDVDIETSEFFGFEVIPWQCSIAPGGLSLTCTGIEPIGGFGLHPIGAGQEACEEPFFGEVNMDCGIEITVKANDGAPSGVVQPTIEACGGGALVCGQGDDPFEVVPFEFALRSFDGAVLDELGEPATQAGSHPHTAFTEHFARTLLEQIGSGVPFESSIADIEDTIVDLPPGVLANPQAYPTCTQAQLFGVFDAVANAPVIQCPAESQVGNVVIYGAFGTEPVPLYNMQRPKGLPALLAFNYRGALIQVYPEIRTEDDYGVKVTAANAPQSLPFYGVTFTVWGVPGDDSHDPERWCPGSNQNSPTLGCEGTDPAKPFFTLPTSCTGPVETFIELTSWEGHSATSSFLSHDNTEPVPNPIGADGCNAVPFEPTVQARPTTNRADAPSGLDVNLHIPQNNDDPEGIATAHLRDTTVTLPEGLVLNPSGANGLDGCAESQVKLKAKGKGNCPGASRLADVQVHSPLVDHPLEGSAYLADPFENPFDSLLALYIVVDDPETGTTVKLAGEVDLDSDGQISATFENNPQLPFEEFELEFFGGSGGALRTPAVCGEYTSEADLTPWTAPEGKTEHPSDTWAIQSGCADSEAALPHAPSFDAGTVSPIAGIDSPFVMHLRREDGSQNIRALNVSPPPGLLAKLAGTAICPEPSLAQAESKDGSDEQDSPSCPATSRLGSVVAGAGAGPQPYYAPGTAYLAGPYKGAPLSIAVITPAVAGPFDLGTILTRIAAHVDPQTARITAISDPLPESLEGIPLDIRTVDVAFDKPGFTRNPTSCDPLAVDGLVVSTLGTLAPVQSRFQVGECGRLGFKPKVFFRLFGKRFTRGSNPRLRAIVMPREGDANIARTAVTMPRSLFLDQSHIRTVCTRVQFAAGACPPGSVYGHATATSPLVDYPISGNVYLRSSDNKLPDLVADLHGPPHQPVRFEVVGRTDSVKGALRNTFDLVPDAPVSKFVLHLQAGRKSLLVASRNLCKGPQRARIEMGAQNGRQLLLQPKIRIPCGKQRKGKGKGKRRNRAAVSRAVAKSSDAG